MINYEWTIISMQYAPSEDNLSKVVTGVYWRLVATEDEHMSYEEDYTNLPKADPNNYVAYEDLKKEDVVSWIEQLIDVDTLKQTLANIIKLKKNPPIVTDNNPFG